jgi:hypothetical protein
VRHVRRLCDFSSRTSFSAHSQASGIFPASLKARAFAKAWLSADRSAADSFPDPTPRALRAAADMLRIASGPRPSLLRRATNLDPQRFDRNVYPRQPARGCHRECRGDGGSTRRGGTGREMTALPTPRAGPRAPHRGPITYCSGRAPPALGDVLPSANVAGPPPIVQERCRNAPSPSLLSLSSSVANFESKRFLIGSRVALYAATPRKRTSLEPSSCDMG